MTKRKILYSPGILITLFFCIACCHVLQSQSNPAIPLEAFEGFKQDSFILPGDSLAQPVFKYGIYKSKVTTTLKGVGKVYVHHVLYFQEDEYSFMEIYSRKPSSGFINGIKRYGNFRMYTSKQNVRDSDFSEKPRIEFVQGINTIIKTIYPLTIYNISDGNELKLWARNVGDVTAVTYEVKDFKKYVDPTLYDSLKISEIGPNCIFSGWIQYDLESDLIKVDLYFEAGEDFVLGTFESVIYDSLGNQVGHINDYGSLSFLSLTADHRYVYTNTGGEMTEDFIAPYVFRIYDLKQNEIIFSRRSSKYELSGFAIPNSNLGVFILKKPIVGEFTEIESYIIDHDKNVMYALHMNPLCQPPSHSTFFPTYCECYTENGLKSKIFYERDLSPFRFKQALANQLKTRF